MIRIENTEVVGWEAAIRGMRNPMNSWDKSDSHFSDCNQCSFPGSFMCGSREYENKNECFLENGKEPCDIIGTNDHELMTKLANGGSVHAKYRRMITVYCDVTAPLYWWKEFDTYKVGTVANSCSTMHKIHEKEFTLDDFSTEHLQISSKECFVNILYWLNEYRSRFIDTKDKDDWWQMIQLLPSSYNQKRTIMLNYEVLTNIYMWRKMHKLDEWCEFCKWIGSLPYSEIITMEK